MSTFYITTPIYYVNDLPHIGHIYTTVMADLIARYRRMAGDEVYFLTGTDEHGQKIEKSAAEEGIKPIELADRVVARYHELWKQLEITHDDFIRTTEPRHQVAVHEMIRRIKENGGLELGSYEGWYCPGCEAFIPDSQVEDNRCPDQGHPVERLSEPSWFFKLSDYQDRLLEWYRANPDCILPKSRYNEVLRFVEGGLRDLSVSRASLSWGVPWPGDPDHVVYVWLDALTNYISALGFGSETSELFDTHWPHALHLVGKDILRFHCVYWPAFLMAAGLEPPKQVFAHGWWLKDEVKMSKSLGNVVRPDHLIERFGADALRYVLARDMVFGQDSSFSDEAFVERYNADLANSLGNALSRLSTMTDRFLDGRSPAVPAEGPIRDAAEDAVAGWRRSMDELQPQRALESTWTLLSAIDSYIQESQPWQLVKDPDKREQLEAVLANGLEALRVVSVMIEPFMPATAAALRARLGLSGAVDLEDLKWGGLPVGSVVEKGDALFPRIDQAAYLAELKAELEANASKQSASDKSPQSRVEPEKMKAINIDAFFETQLLVGKILSAEPIPKSKKLLRMQIDLGEEEPRQIVAGIAKVYPPEELPGRRVVVVANLEPAKLMGVVSQGMVLAATDSQGQPRLLDPAADAPIGSRVR